MDVSNDILDDESMIQPTISELENRIITLELRNRELEIRNCTLTKTVGLLSTMEIGPQQKINRVNKCVSTILHKNRERIAAITHLGTKNEDNQQVYDIVDHWSKCLTLEDFLHGDNNMDNGFRNRPVFSPEDHVTIYNSVTSMVDQKSLQKLARMFSKTLTPALCGQFTYLRGDTRHPDVLTSYLSAILTLQLFALNHTERSCFFYKMSSRAWTKYGTEEHYQEHVLEPNSFDLIQEVPDEAAGPAIDLRSQRKRFRPELVMLN